MYKFVLRWPKQDLRLRKEMFTSMKKQILEYSIVCGCLFMLKRCLIVTVFVRVKTYFGGLVTLASFWIQICWATMRQLMRVRRGPCGEAQCHWCKGLATNESSLINSQVMQRTIPLYQQDFQNTLHQKKFTLHPTAKYVPKIVLQKLLLYIIKTALHPQPFWCNMKTNL